MSGFGIAVADEVLNGLFLVFLYASVGGFAFRWLIPRLSFHARILTAVMLAAQIIVLLVSQTVETTSAFDARLWELRHEWNIPSTLATAQLATVGGVMLLIFVFCNRRPAWYRAIFLGLGLVFLFFAWDEFYSIHEEIQQWDLKYSILGCIVVSCITVVMARSPGSERIWSFSLLIGIGISAMGSILFERISRVCGQVLFLRVEGCFKFFVWEESSEFLGIWLALVAVLGIQSIARPVPSKFVSRSVIFFPLLWLILITAFTFLARVEMQLFGTAADVQFDSDVRLVGFRLDNSAKRAGDNFPVNLYVSAEQEDYFWLGYSVHLVDQISGESIAHRDMWAKGRQGLWVLGPMYEPVFSQRVDTAIPTSAPANRALWAVLSLWRPQSERFRVQEVLASDLLTLSPRQVVLGELVLSAEPAAASDLSFLAAFENGFFLHEAGIPAIAEAGKALSIRIFWRTEAAGDDDFIQFLHLGHEKSGEWFVYDQQPLGARLPTRLWYSGLADSETWEVPLPPDLAPGRYSAFTGLYRASDDERVIARDADGNPFLDARVPLGSLLIET